MEVVVESWDCGTIEIEYYSKLVVFVWEENEGKKIGLDEKTLRTRKEKSRRSY